MEALLSAALPALFSAGAAGLGSVFGRKREKGTPDQKRKQQLLDQLMSSIGGDGPFSHLFNMDEDSFQKNFVDPAKSRFNNQISPQIQQSFIQSGQQRGTGLDDTLTRAGVDMDQLLNQEFGKQQQSAMDRQLQAIGFAGKANSGMPGEDVGAGTAFLQGAGGALGSKNFLRNSFQAFRGQNDGQSNIFDRGAGGSTGAPIAAAGSAGPINRKGFRR